MEWPLPKSRALTATFGEYRGLRLHAGIDLSTFGRTGLEVRAVERGRIVRLKVERRGYGRALYVEHPNGLVSVYAHLERFEEDTLGLETLVRTYQRARDTPYPGDIYPEPSLAVERGQTIGYSGESGAGPPHLHVEFRRGMETLVHPFAARLPLPSDSAPPRVEGLMFLPRSADARIKGLPLPHRVDFRRRQVPAMSLWGEWELVLLAYDPCARGARCGLYTWGAKLNDRPFSEAKVSSFSYDDPSAGGLLHHLAFCFPQPAVYGYRLGAVPPDSEGFQRLVLREEGEFVLRLRAEDFSGNASVRSVILRGVRPSPAGEGAGGKSASFSEESPLPTRLHESRQVEDPRSAGQVTLHPSARFLALEADSSLPLTASLHQGGHVLAEAAFFRAGERAFATLPLGNDAAGGMVQVRRRGRSVFEAPLLFAWAGREPVTLAAPPRFQLLVPADAAWEPGAVWARVVEDIPPAEELAPFAALDVLPEGMPFRHAPRLTGLLPSVCRESRRIGWYRKAFREERWIYLEGECEGRETSVSIPYGARYALMEDRVPPVIEPRHPRPGQSVPASAVEWHARACDRGSGVDYESVRFVLDGVARRGDYDPDRFKVFLNLAYEEIRPSRGEHTLRIEAADRAGNAATREFRFTVR
ncbi:MAG: M23 family metallopeptidase [Acidobacteriota bacterium]|nr:MAG: M23 family metallopeptidase [Acidobacteriota bacterium]